MSETDQVKRLWVANRQQLTERSFILFDCVYAETVSSVILVRSSGQCYGYLNRCVHMPFRLDCESNDIFRVTDNRIKCSMHGIIYHPETGASLSPTMCTGETLTPVQTEEDDEGIWIVDERVELRSQGKDCAGN